MIKTDHLRIVGGIETKLHEFPFIILIISETRKEYNSSSTLWNFLAKYMFGVEEINSTSCTGAILSEDWVITAGHCVESEKKLGSREFTIKVFAGIHDRIKSTGNIQAVGVKRVLIHHQFDRYKISKQ